MNATIAPLPWWPKREGLTFEWALRARAGMEDRTHQRWWYPEVPQDVLLPMESMEAVLAALRAISKEQVRRPALIYAQKSCLGVVHGALHKGSVMRGGSV